MSSEELSKLVLPAEGGSNATKEWIPEDYGFISRDESRTVFYKGKYELRRRQYNNWLLRKNRKNERGNSEMLIKWGMLVIEPTEIAFADLMFTLGLR